MSETWPQEDCCITDPTFRTGSASIGQSIVVVTELWFRSHIDLLRAAFRFRAHRAQISADLPSLRYVRLLVLWSSHELIHISFWDDLAASTQIGRSRRHVADVRWAMTRSGVRTRSVVYQSRGHWRDNAIYDRRNVGTRLSSRMH